MADVFTAIFQLIRVSVLLASRVRNRTVRSVSAAVHVIASMTAVFVPVGRVTVTGDDVCAAYVAFQVASQLLLVVGVNSLDAAGWWCRSSGSGRFRIRVRGLVLECLDDLEDDHSEDGAGDRSNPVDPLCGLESDDNSRSERAGWVERTTGPENAYYVFVSHL